MAVKGPELIKSRSTEIVDACEKLYHTHGYRDVTIKLISTETSISRPSIYNYFQTKEEIFLAVLKREYLRWADDLKKIRDSSDRMTPEDLADAIAKTLESRGVMLKIETMNLYEIEENSREERLVEFKKAVCLALSTMDECIRKFLPELSDEDRSAIRYCFVPFLYGIYSSTSLTEKQKHAMDRAGMCCAVPGVNDICRIFLLKLFRP